MTISLIRLCFGASLLVIIFLFLNRNLWTKIVQCDLGLKYIACFLAFCLLAWLSLRPPRQFAALKPFTRRHLLYFAFLCVFTFLALEVLVRLVTGDSYQTYSAALNEKRYIIDGAASNSHKMSVPDENYYAFKLKADLDTTVTDRKYGVSQHVVTNSDGFRFTIRQEPLPIIMALGDSATFGVGVDNGHTYPDRLQELLDGKDNVLNFGVGGWGFAEYYLAYLKYVDRCKPKLVLIGVFPANDYTDLYHTEWAGKNADALPVPPLIRKDCRFDPSGVLLPNDIIYRIPLLRDSAACVFLGKALIEPFVQIFTVKDDLKDMEALSQKIIAAIARRQSTLVVLIPAKYELAAGHQPSQAHLKRLSDIPNVHVLNLFPYFADKTADSYVDSAHLSEVGNRRAAREIFAFINNNGLR